MDSIGENIRRIRKEKSISMYELAKAVGVAHTTIASIEKGKTKSITIYLAQEIAKTLNVSISELIKLDDIVFNTNELVRDLNEEITNLKQKLEEKEELIELLKIKNNSFKSWLVQLFVDDTQHTLSYIKDPIEKEKLYSLFDKNYNYYKKIGIISDNDIALHISGKESVYKDFLDWYKKNI